MNAYLSNPPARWPEARVQPLDMFRVRGREDSAFAESAGAFTAAMERHLASTD